MRSKDLIPLHYKSETNMGDITPCKDDLAYRVTWETLPLGEEGLQTEIGLRLGEEPHLVHVNGFRLWYF